MGFKIMSLRGASNGECVSRDQAISSLIRGGASLHLHSPALASGASVRQVQVSLATTYKVREGACHL